MTATGFNLSPLPSGEVLIEFHGNDDVAINTQVITRECLARFPVVAHALFVAVENGKEAAQAYLNRMSMQDHMTNFK